MTNWKHILLWLLGICLLLAGFVLYCNIRITHYARPRLFDSVPEVPHYHAALVLGTAPTLMNGTPNLYFRYRIKACSDLYHAGKIDRIIVSGDNRHVSYNEPEEMKNALINKGIPADVIFLDYAGFRTFDSVVRAQKVFGQSSFIVVSQKFHNERAIYIAAKKGIDAVGYNARDVNIHYGLSTRIRECFARCKVFLDLLIGKKPHFLGDPVDIG